MRLVRGLPHATTIRGAASPPSAPSAAPAMTCSRSPRSSWPTIPTPACAAMSPSRCADLPAAETKALFVDPRQAVRRHRQERPRSHRPRRRQPGKRNLDRHQGGPGPRRPRRAGPTAFAKLTWRLWPSDAVPDLAHPRLEHRPSPPEQRRFAVESLAFINHRSARRRHVHPRRRPVPRARPRPPPGC